MSEVSYSLVVLDGRKRIIEMMQQLLPFLVRRRFAESLCVIRERPPAHKQQVAVRSFDATLQLVRQISRRCRDDALRAAERGFELLRLLRLHVEDRLLEDHRGSRRCRNAQHSSVMTRNGYAKTGSGVDNALSGWPEKTMTA